VPQISTGVSLGVIVLVLAVTTLLKVRRDPGTTAHAGSVRGHSAHEHRAGADHR